MIVTPKAAPSTKTPRKHSVGASSRPELEPASKRSSVVEEIEPFEEPIAEEVEEEEEEEEAVEEAERMIEEEPALTQEPEPIPLADTIVPEPSKTTSKADPFSLHGPVSLRSDQVCRAHSILLFFIYFLRLQFPMRPRALFIGNCCQFQ